MKILDIGKLINSLFKQLNINIYPLVAENSATMPFAVYSRTQTEHYSKDKSIQRAYYTIELICEQYKQSINLLQRVIDLCSIVHEYDNNKVRLNIESTNEFYDENYHQIATIIIEI